MSASKKKQQRKANAEASEELFSKKNGKEEKKESGAKYAIAGIVVAVALVLSIAVLVIQGFVAPNAAAMTIGSEKIYSHELNYYYINAYSNFVNQVGTEYASQLFGLDTTQSLKTQTYYADSSMTWHDYFLNTAKTSAQQIHMLADAAKAEGVTLSEEYEAYVQDEMSGLADYVAENGYSMDSYLSAMYGKRMDQAEYERLVRNGYLASQYSEAKSEEFSSSYTDDDLTNYYNEHKNDFDLVTYRRYLVTAATEDGMTDTQRNEALNAARSTAEAMANGSTSEAEFIAQVVTQKNKENAAAAANTAEGEEATEPTEYTGDQAETDTLQSEVAYSSFSTTNESSAAQAEWLFDEARTTGDVTTIDTTTGTYVFFFMERSRHDYNTVDVRHILVSFDSFDAEGNPIADDAENTDENADSSTETTDAQRDAAQAEAERILAEWKDGAATEESFGELAKQYTDDSNGEQGGLYEQVYQGRMVTNFNDWIFGSGREPGDTGVISTDYGYHVMYFVGENDPYWMVQVRSAKASADYNAWAEAKFENYAMKDKSGISNVGLANGR